MQMPGIWICYTYVGFSLFPLRSEKRQFRISMPSLARRDPLTQDVPLRQLRFLLYVVFLPCPVTARSPPLKGDVVIPCAWYTSGKLLYDRKSDHRETAIR